MSSSQKRQAGKASGIKRANLAKLRRLTVLSAFERLDQSYQDHPRSKRSMEELENELNRSEQRRSVLEALEQTLESPLADHESVVEVIEDPISHLLGREERGVRRKLHSEKHDLLLDEVVSGFLLRHKNKKKKRNSTAPDDRRQEVLSKDLTALRIKSKKAEKKSG
jgi:hypothetical protein